MDNKKYQDLVEGGIYSVETESRDISIVKILVLEPQGVHVRLYKNTFKQRPNDIDTKTLTLGGFDDEDGFGIGHLPLNKSAFLNSNPQLIKQEPVLDTELDGYREWQDADAGYFDFAF